MTIPNQAPLGGFGGAKERSEATRGPRPGAVGPAGPDSKGNTAQQYYPNFDLLTFDLIQKNQKAKKLGASITPTSAFWPRG